MNEDNTSPSFMDSFGKHLYMGFLQFAILMHIKQLRSYTVCENPEVDFF